ncbi:MAG: SemiSWEET transporter, partial [Steroidobacteraceae bacterium]
RSTAPSARFWLGICVTVTIAIGFAAAFCTTFALVPALLKAWRSRSTADVSLGWSTVLTLGTALWFVYGLLLHDLPLIVANGTSLALSGTILGLKLRHG